MAFEDVMADTERLLGEIENRPEDKHELYLELAGKLNEIRAMGMPVPEDLVRLERELEETFAETPEKQTTRPQSRERNR